MDKSSLNRWSNIINCERKILRWWNIPIKTNVALIPSNFPSLIHYSIISVLSSLLFRRSRLKLWSVLLCTAFFYTHNNSCKLIICFTSSSWSVISFTVCIFSWNSHFRCLRGFFLSFHSLQIDSAAKTQGFKLRERKKREELSEEKWGKRGIKDQHSGRQKITIEVAFKCLKIAGGKWAWSTRK